MLGGMSFDETQQHRKFRTFPQFAEENPAFPVANLRKKHFFAKPRADRPPNGFGQAFIKDGRRVLVDVDAFFRVLREKNEKAHGS